MVAMARFVAAVLAVAACVAGFVLLRDDGRAPRPADRQAALPRVARAARPPAAPPPIARRRRPPRMPTGTDVRAVLRRAVLTGAIDRGSWAAWHADLARAQGAVRRLTGARQAELSSVLATLEDLAASDRLTASRMPLAFLTLRRNTRMWRVRAFPHPSQRLTFGGDPVVFQYFPGRGIQVHGLATAGRANALAVPCLKVAQARAARAVARARRVALRRRLGGRVRPLAPRRTAAHRGRCRPAALRRDLDRLVAVSSSRGGYRAWEYLFAYGGGTAPWVSAMTQATAAQALARGSVALGVPRYRTAALQALGAFQDAPPVGVSLPAPGGRRFVMYSFAPSLRILNGFLQSVIGLHDVADLTGSARAWRLYHLGERTARRSIAAFDTGAWSRYSFDGRESTLSYHELVTGFLAGMCERTGRPVYCDEASRFDRYLHEPPRIRLTTPPRLRQERPAAVSVWVSKVSAARVTVRDRRGVVLSTGGELPRGSYRYAFVPPRAGGYTVSVRATGPRAATRSPRHGCGRSPSRSRRSRSASSAGAPPSTARRPRPAPRSTGRRPWAAAVGEPPRDYACIRTGAASPALGASGSSTGSGFCFGSSSDATTNAMTTSAERPPERGAERLGHRAGDARARTGGGGRRGADAAAARRRRGGRRCALASSTDMTAVPIEAPTCWLMFSVVDAAGDLPRGAASASRPRTSASSSRPCRGPCTNSTAPTAPSRTCRPPSCVRPRNDSGDDRQADRHDPADAGLVGQPAGDRHRDHRAEALRGQQQAGVQRATRRARPAGTAAAAACAEDRDDHQRRASPSEAANVRFVNSRRSISASRACAARGRRSREHEQRRPIDRARAPPARRSRRRSRTRRGRRSSAPGPARAARGRASRGAASGCGTSRGEDPQRQRSARRRRSAC